MRVISWDSFAGSRPLRNTRSSMTIGVFDGIHLGHRRLLDRILSTDTDEAIVTTFRYNPRIFLKPHLYPGDITTLEQKLGHLRDLGVDTVILIDFSNDFSKLTGREFVMSIHRNCRLRLLVLGDNFRCGYQGATNAYDVRDILAEKSVDVDIEPPVTWKGSTLSSTRIRAAIREGEVEEAREMMQGPYVLDIASAPVERKEELKSVEKASLHQVLPPPGRYLVDIHTPTRVISDEIVVDHEELMWSYHGEEETKTIEFVRKTGEGA